MRAGFTVLWGAMIAEQRAVQLDLHTRATFTKDGDTVRDTRSLIADFTKPEPSRREHEVKQVRTSARLSAAFEDGFVEVG